jgi:hypothetical protein
MTASIVPRLTTMEKQQAGTGIFRSAPGSVKIYDVVSLYWVVCAARTIGNAALFTLVRLPSGDDPAA